MKQLAERLRAARQRRDLSLRDLAEAMGELGYRTSHESIRNYETGARTIPVEYVRTLAVTLGVDPLWLLFGEDGRAPGPGGEPLHVATIDGIVLPAPEPELVAAVRDSWRAFLAHLPAQGPIRPEILQSWERSRASGVRARSAEPSFRRVTPEELEERLHDAAGLVQAASPHLRWVSERLGSIEHVVYVTDADGIVLQARARPDALADLWHLRPGFDWSEATMGTNGAGTCLRTGRITGVIGPEHFMEAFHDATCLAAPIRSETGASIGAIDLSTRLQDGQPDRLMLVAYAAAAIEHDLKAAPAGH